MIGWLLALALGSSGQGTQLTPAEAASEAAVQIFQEACVQGQLKLTPDRGRILSDKETGANAFIDIDMLQWDWPKKSHVTVAFNYPPRTYLVTAEFGRLQSHSFASDCILISGSITKKDAMAALMRTAPDVTPLPTYLSQFYEPEWTIDQPKNGFRSLMEVREDDSIVLEVDMYNKSSQPSGKEPQ